MENQNSPEHPTQNQTLLDDKNLNQIVQYVKSAQMGHKRSIPPLDQWQPMHCGRMNLVVKSNGEWWHEGQLIQRKALIDLFSSVLCKEEGQFYLKTPVEKIAIDVEDEPLFIQHADQIIINGKTYIQLTSSNDDIIVLDEQHSLFMRVYQDELRPYVYMRFGVNALIQRSAFLHLVEMGELLENQQGEVILNLRSGDLCLQLQS